MTGMDFKGLGVAMVTPFNKDGSVDFKGLDQLTESLLAAKTDYLVVMGTTGEAATLTETEQNEVLQAVYAKAKGKAKIVFGCGGNNTKAVAAKAASLDHRIIDGILSASPSYNKPTQKGIVAHYQAVSEASSIPIILYNVPGRTASNMLASTTLEIARTCKNVVAIKEASGDLEQVADIIKDKPEGFEVISGDDALTVPMISLGGIGAISVVGNAYPERFGNAIHAALKGDYGQARSLYYPLHGLIPLLFKEGNPAGVKEVLKHLDICDHYQRMPLMPVSEVLRESLVAYIAKENL